MNSLKTYLFLFFFILLASCRNIDSNVFTIKLEKSNLDTSFRGGWVTFLKLGKRDTVIKVNNTLIKGLVGYFEGSTFDGQSYLTKKVPVFVSNKNGIEQIYFDTNLDSLWDNEIPYNLDQDANIRIKFIDNTDKNNQNGSILYVNPITSAIQFDNDKKLHRKTIGIVMKSFLKQGEILLDNHKYLFVLPGLFEKNRDRKDGFIVFVDSSDIVNKTPLTNNLMYHVNDTIYLGKNIFRLKVIDTLHQYVKIEKISILDSSDGITVQTYLPAINEKDINNKPIHIGGKKDKYTLLDFWGTWCQPCRELSPSLLDLYKTNITKLDVISIAADFSKEDVVNYTFEKGIKWPTIYQDYATSWITRKLKVEIFPTFFLLDKNGKIIFRGSGKGGFKKISFILNTVS